MAHRSYFCIKNLLFGPLQEKYAIDSPARRYFSSCPSGTQACSSVPELLAPRGLAIIVGFSMFIAAISTIAKTWKRPKCPSTDDWIKKMWYVYTMEYYSAIKRMK